MLVARFVESPPERAGAGAGRTEVDDGRFGGAGCGPLGVRTGAAVLVGNLGCGPVGYIGCDVLGGYACWGRDGGCCG
jgi:hypothetical protein